MEKTFSKSLLLEASAFSPSSNQSLNGEEKWLCPSNIAIIKYWGKRAVQFPMNPSLSMTLQHSNTSTRVEYKFDPDQKYREIRFRFEGRETPAFEERIRRFINSIEPFIPVLTTTSLDIESGNTFPHSSGIASSASAMGSLALCLVHLEAVIMGIKDPVHLTRKASFIARLGSGSASRSLYPFFALWGRSDHWDDSSDEFAIPVTDFHPSFNHIRDSILIVDSKQKQISSSTGHALMENNPFSNARFRQARENLSALKMALKEGDWEKFIALMEHEALSLHAMMMTGRPGYLLMQPGTLSIIRKVKEFRKETGFRIGFTLDAGANVHLLYADADATQVAQFISSDLTKFCEDERVINDRMGEGPKNP